MPKDRAAEPADRVAAIDGWPVPRDPEPLVWEDEAEEAPPAAAPPAERDPLRARPA